MNFVPEEWGGGEGTTATSVGSVRVSCADERRLVSATGRMSIRVVRAHIGCGVGAQWLCRAEGEAELTSENRVRASATNERLLVSNTGRMRVTLACTEYSTVEGD